MLSLKNPELFRQQAFLWWVLGSLANQATP